MEETKKRKPRVLGPEAKVKIIDRKIAKLLKQVAELEAEKEEILKPIKTKELIAEAIKNMSPEEVAEKLGISLE